MASERESTRSPSGDIWMSLSKMKDMKKDQPPITTMP
jgi:hypothetical protein